MKKEDKWKPSSRPVKYLDALRDIMLNVHKWLSTSFDDGPGASAAILGENWSEEKRELDFLAMVRKTRLLRLSRRPHSGRSIEVAKLQSLLEGRP